MTKVVFIAHPIRGDVTGNVLKVLEICKEVHRGGVIPVVPYLVSLQYLNDNVVEDRKLGIEANLECFQRHFIDELWLFGNQITEGMRSEVLLALMLEIPIVAKTLETLTELNKIIAGLAPTK